MRPSNSLRYHHGGKSRPVQLQIHYTEQQHKEKKNDTVKMGVNMMGKRK